MDTQQRDNQSADQNSQNQQSGTEQQHSHKKGGIHSNALFAASMGRAATAQVDPHSDRGMGQTGTNVSYEGATSAGSGGSVGSGFTSGQSGVNTSITTDSDFDQVNTGNAPVTSAEEIRKADEAEDEMNEQR